MLKPALITATSLAFASNAFARPVSYAGGWTLIEETDRQSTSALIHYSPSAKYSLGLKTEWDRREDILFTGVQGTWLAKRWFGEDHQANLYFWGAAGLAQDIDDNTGGDQAGGQIGVMADWETRRLFVSYRAAARDFGDLDKSVMQAARVGFAPYAGDTGDLHTWFMLEVDNRPDDKEPIGVTPLVRFFYGSALFEAGWSVTDDQPLLNFQYRF
ncbi:hypothetical protein [Litorimonas sp. WD9-15]|uniref:hypothetical protein n=1 Tax=Litorimonas sp. WD9-15 TaxID=3418716 RepID=UPI003D03953C